MIERDEFLSRVQAHLKLTKCTLTLPNVLHDYIYQSYLSENVEFSVGCFGDGFTVRFLLRGNAKQHLGTVHDNLTRLLARASVQSHRVTEFHKDGKDRATVVVDYSDLTISDQTNLPNALDIIKICLDVFWRYFVLNRKFFEKGQAPEVVD